MESIEFGEEPSEKMKELMRGVARRKKSTWEARFDRLAVGKSFAVGRDGDIAPLESSARVLCYRYGKKLHKTFKCTEHLDGADYWIEVARID
jgi:hypothetical protein